MDRSYQTLAFLVIYVIVFGVLSMVLAHWESISRKRKRQKRRELIELQEANLGKWPDSLLAGSDDTPKENHEKT